MERVMFNQTTVRYSQGICAFSCAGFTIGAVANKYLKSTVKHGSQLCLVVVPFSC